MEGVEQKRRIELIQEALFEQLLLVAAGDGKERAVASRVSRVLTGLLEDLQSG